jgi:hypothetical protein
VKAKTVERPVFYKKKALLTSSGGLKPGQGMSLVKIPRGCFLISGMFSTFAGSKT